MRFSILGETLARRDDGTEVPVGGPARRALLTLLLVRPGEVVAAERLADEMAPDGSLSAHALQSQVSRLRAALGADVIERAGAGYRVAVAPEDVDAGRFERLAREGRAALAGAEPERARELLCEALELWRGPALADVAHLPGGDTARTVRVRLEELRLGALEDRIEAELRLGGHRDAVAELRELTGRHPLRERLAALLIRALSADGGQAQALAAYEETRIRLADELGSDPSAELVALHRELLEFDPSPAQVRPPAQLTSFVGRDGEVAEVARMLRVARLVTLVGPGGVGKTRLSVEAAGAAADDVCFVGLASLREGSGLPGAVLAALGLRESGLQPGGGQGPVDRLATALADRVLLLVLDNCEHLAGEAAALAGRLLSVCPQLRILATSREPLGVIGEHLWPVRPLEDAAALRLFTERASAVRRGFTAAPERVERICAALDNLPLAIELAAARLRTMDVDDLAERLDDRLGIAAARANRGADARHRTLRAVVAWSWDLLSGEEQRAARRFTVFPGGATPRAALTVCRSGGRAPGAGELESGGLESGALESGGLDSEVLESLVDKSLLEFSGGRLRMLETVRAYGAERLEEAGETASASGAHTRYVLELARTAEPLLRGAGQREWLERLAAGHGDLLSALGRAVGQGHWETALELLASASGYLWIRGVSGSVAAQAAAVLDAVGDAPPAGLGEEYAACVLLAAGAPGGLAPWRRHRARAWELLAAAWDADGPGGRYPVVLLPWMLRNATEADPLDAFALVSAQCGRPEPWVRAVAAYVSGFGPLGAGDPAAAERAFAEAAEGFRAVGDGWGGALVLDVLAGMAAARGDRAGAVALTDEALALTERLGALEDSADLLVNRADHLVDADPARARADYARAESLARRAGGSAALAAALRGLGDLALREGDGARAEHLYAEALERIDPHWVKSAGSRVRALAGLGRVAESYGDHAAARTRYAQAAASAAAVVGAAAPAALRLLGLPQDVVDTVSAHAS
ncbi:BTAD domain-containing putative transcriptional regulator [Streptomyces polychromogenes]|uniref:BTAD domain-containing putative transcriptional regulator n=1 Tax=Streptomyces polychromogenes TaxID=67342 RepID=A0ABP3F353_9ACTN